MMTTLTTPTSGTARVAGYDVVEEPDMVRKSMGLTGQAATVDELLTGRENLRLIGSLYGLSSAYVRQASDDLLERFSLDDAGNRVVKTYSGGMRRRLDLAVSLIATPPVLFLDEPTTGLDPRSRVELWDVLRGLVVGRHDPAAHDAVPRGGRPARRPDRGDRPRPGDRGGHAARAQGPVRQGRARGDRVRGRRPARGRADCCARLVDEVHVEPNARQLTAPANGLADVTRIAGAFDGSAASSSTTSASSAPASTTSSCT